MRTDTETSDTVDNATTSLQPADYFAVGQAAHARGAGNLPFVDPAVYRAVEGRAVGDPVTRKILTAFNKGWTAANLAADVPDEDECDTDGCDGRLDDGEGWDGKCGTCADQATSDDQCVDIELRNVLTLVCGDVVRTVAADGETVDYTVGTVTRFDENTVHVEVAGIVNMPETVYYEPDTEVVVLMAS
ncbi:hypothetical protein [Rhodococcus qingshengii]|uniref:Uncharacterized protein n=1 Tax=Rhodococcus qingshengii TaxID=334542 RepID=A0A2A5J201_RHOSG|nr:hypothetical protein [Rhodococcus qingshengii]PCK23267.1 hypothetical protein CHR55_30420 [Rhodococcus qingshengii]